MYKKAICFILATILMLPATFVFATEATDAISTQWADGGEIDSLNGVIAYGEPGMDCYEFVKRYCQQVFGLHIGFSYPDQPDSNQYGAFILTDSPQVGDVVYWPAVRRDKSYGHFAIIKEVKASSIVLIEQNWTWNGKWGINREIKFPSDTYDVWTCGGTAGRVSPVSQPELPEVIYNQQDKGAEMILPVDVLSQITDEVSAFAAIGALSSEMSDEERGSALGVDKLQVFAETALSGISSKEYESGPIHINKLLADKLADKTGLMKDTLSEAILRSGIGFPRDIRTIASIKTNSTQELTIKLDADLIDIKPDRIDVIAPFGGVSISQNSVSDVSVTIAQEAENKIKVNLSKGISKPITIIFHNTGSEGLPTVVDARGEVYGGKYNPATNSFEAKITQSGVYEVCENGKVFTDISEKPDEMKSAINKLASLGIISGTTDTEFSPDLSITRAETAALILRIYGLLDANAVESFSDVDENHWYKSVAGSSQQAGVINGNENGEFDGDTAIQKDQFISICARMLKNHMKYALSQDNAPCASYSDCENIDDWAKTDISLALIAGLIPNRTDNGFAPYDKVTRGDAAVMLNRLYERTWL